MSQTTAAGARTEQMIACRYVADILAGLVPNDPQYDRIYEAVVRNDDRDFVALAADIKAIRNGER